MLFLYIFIWIMYEIRMDRFIDRGHSAPNTLAIWTAKCPTPPAAPMMATFMPFLIPPASLKDLSAVRPAIGMVAASSNVMFSGFGYTFCSGADTYSAKDPRLIDIQDSNDMIAFFKAHSVYEL